uniref:hypothetical protein n=1 Tax=Salmonella sp. TaxID=599 RepID=UPI001CD9189F|nr:hypothetical protein [Salmonella sp.]
MAGYVSLKNGGATESGSRKGCRQAESKREEQAAVAEARADEAANDDISLAVNDKRFALRRACCAGWWSVSEDVNAVYLIAPGSARFLDSRNAKDAIRRLAGVSGILKQTRFADVN